MPAKPLSDEQREDAKKLKALFQKWKDALADTGRPASQEDIVTDLGFGQSALSQYLNGSIPLNIPVSIKFSELLGVPIKEFSPSLAEAATQYAEAIARATAPHGPGAGVAKESKVPPEAAQPSVVAPISGEMVVLSREEHQKLLDAQSETIERVNAQERKLLSFFRGTTDIGRGRMLMAGEQQPRSVESTVVNNKS